MHYRINQISSRVSLYSEYEFAKGDASAAGWIVARWVLLIALRFFFLELFERLA
jgi:hypothetical protein